MRISKPTERKFSFENDPDGGWVIIKQLSPGERADIFDDVFAQEVEYKPDEEGTLVPVFKQSTNKRKDREDTFTKSIVDWGSFYDKEGNELPCTPENIIKAMREIAGFNEAIQEFRKTLDEDITKEVKDQEKN